MDFSIQLAQTEDLPQVLQLIQELADFEKEPDAVEIDINEFTQDFKEKRFNCWIAKSKDQIVAMALFYYRYSTWKGKTIHLEDLVVTKKCRRKGIGQALLKKIILQAKEEQLRRVEWNVLNWNTPAIELYKNIGAQILEDWYVVQLDKTGINTF